MGKQRPQNRRSSKKRPRLGILTGQSLGRGRSRGNSRGNSRGGTRRGRLVKLLFLSTVAACVLYAGYEGSRYFFSGSKASREKTLKPVLAKSRKKAATKKVQAVNADAQARLQKMTFIVKPESGYNLTDKEIRSLRKAALRSRDDSLEEIAKSVHKASEFASVHVFMPEPGKVIIRPNRRAPFAIIKADKMRYLTKSGIIYGKVDHQDLHKVKDSNLIPVLGIFDLRKSKKGYSWLSKSNRLKLRDEEQEIVGEAIELIEALREHDFAANEIRFNPYRGFIAKLRINKIEVYLGRAPFAARFARLRQILDNLSRKGVLYSRIELDYEGKAFIRENSESHRKDVEP